MIGAIQNSLRLHALQRPPRTSSPEPPAAAPRDRVDLSAGDDTLRRRAAGRRVAAAVAAGVVVAAPVGFAVHSSVQSLLAPEGPVASLSIPAPRRERTAPPWAHAPAAEKPAAPTPEAKAAPAAAPAAEAKAAPAAEAPAPQRPAAPEVKPLEVPRVVPHDRAPIQDPGHPAQPWRGRMVYENLSRGSRGEEVSDMQEALLKWMPSWSEYLKADGVYGEQTAQAIAVFKEIYGLGQGGDLVEPGTAFALRAVDNGSWWGRDPVTGKYPYSIKPGKGDLYNKAVHGHPFDGLARLAELARRAPDTMVTHRGFPMQARTAWPLARMEKALALEGYSLHLTATTGGRHASWEHPAGRAVDFAILKNGTYIDDLGYGAMSYHSERVASAARRFGFLALNEYLTHTAYRTGPHIHLAI